MGLASSVPTEVFQEWVRNSDGRLSFVGFTKLLHGISARAARNQNNKWLILRGILPATWIIFPAFEEDVYSWLHPLLCLCPELLTGFSPAVWFVTTHQSGFKFLLIFHFGNLCKSSYLSQTAKRIGKDDVLTRRKWRVQSIQECTSAHIQCVHWSN